LGYGSRKLRCGLFHPSVREIYKDYPVIREFARDLEKWFNARLSLPIRRVGYAEESSTAVAEAFASFFRQLERVDRIPRKIETKPFLRGIKKPVYFGLIDKTDEEKSRQSRF